MAREPRDADHDHLRNVAEPLPGQIIDGAHVMGEGVVGVQIIENRVFRGALPVSRRKIDGEDEVRIEHFRRKRHPRADHDVVVRA